MTAHTIPAPQVDERPRRLLSAETLFHNATRLAAILVLVVLTAIGVSLLMGGWEALAKFGPAFLWTESWNPVKEEFGALVPIYGTVVTSLIAMLIGVPLSLGIAMFLTEICPNWLRQPIGIAIELLAGIPSIIYGMWGLFVFAPFFANHIEPWLIDVLGPLPILGPLFQGAPYGVGLLTGGLILTIMVLPFITSVIRDVFETVPPMLKESAYGLGCTTWEVVWNVVIPHTRTGIVGGLMLGLGRALGETMAVTFVIGNAHRLSASLLAPGNTISSALANEFTEAVGDIYLSSLIALGLILFVLTSIVLGIAKWMLVRLDARVSR